MKAAKETAAAAEQADDGRVNAADQELARQLAERAKAEGLSLTGPGGLLGRLTKVVLEGTLEGEMDAHLGYEKHDPAGRDGGNSRNGHRAKTVLTDVGPVEIAVPRDRDASFEPKIVAKRTAPQPRAGLERTQLAMITIPARQSTTRPGVSPGGAIILRAMIALMPGAWATAC